MKVKSPFLVVNPKSYLYGQKSLELAKAADETAAAVGIPVLFTCPYADIRLIRENTEHVIVCAQSMDPLTPGRGMGHILPESLKEAGADAVLAEPTDLIGTGQVADDSYTIDTVKALHEIDPEVLVMIASGVTTADDCYNVIHLGADGTGATSGILKAPSPAVRIREMAEAIAKAGRERGLL